MVSPQRRIQYVSVHILLEGVRGCKGSEKQPVFCGLSHEMLYGFICAPDTLPATQGSSQ